MRQSALMSLAAFDLSSFATDVDSGDRSRAATSAATAAAIDETLRDPGRCESGSDQRVGPVGPLGPERLADLPRCSITAVADRPDRDAGTARCPGW